MRILVGTFLFFTSLPAALACSCAGSAPFFEKAYRADLVVLGTVVSHEGHGMDFRIESVYRGDESRDVIRVWGDDGASCRPYTRTFATNSRWVLTLQVTSGNIDGETPGEDYAAQGCGEAHLAVSGNSVYLSDRQERWQIERLVTEIGLLDRMPPPILAREIEENRIRDLLLNGESGTAAPSPASPVDQATANCRSTTRQAIDGVGISAAEPIAAGGLDPPAGADQALARAYGQLPAICRVAGVFMPARDAIRPFELWIPLRSWSGQTAGVVIELAAASPDLVSAVGAGPLARGTAIFALMTPAGESDTADVLTRFRGIVDRMRPVSLSSPRAYLGNTMLITGAMDPSRPSVAIVPRGPGRIEGRATLLGQPVANLKLRLALNSRLWSPWLSTDRDGYYSFDLPYGEYSIDGYQLDSNSADRLLPGAVDFPHVIQRVEPLKVDDSGPAQGFEFRYVYPVRVQWPVGSVTIDQARQVVWDPYPGAASYTLRVDRRDSAPTPNGLRKVWMVQNLAETSARLPPDALYLAPGIYDIVVWAIDANGEAIATVPGYRGVEFQIVE